MPVDFIIPAISHNEIGNHHQILLSNILAQGEALMQGKTVEEAALELEKAGKSKDEIEALKNIRAFPAIVRPIPLWSKSWTRILWVCWLLCMNTKFMCKELFGILTLLINSALSLVKNWL